MRKLQIFLICSFLFCFAPAVSAQKTQKQDKALAQAERELKEFFEDYAEDLRQHRGAAIAERYDARGYYRMGGGVKTLVSFEDNKKRFTGTWDGPKTFEWKNLTIEALTKDSAVVTGVFDWQLGTSPSRTYSYTGVLTKQKGKWLIRVEDESVLPIPQATTTPITGRASETGAFKYLYNAAAGASLSAHRHSVDMRITVRSGRKFILMGDLADAKVQVFETGSTFTIPAGTWHVEWWETDTVEEIEGTGPMLTERATPTTPRAP